MRLSDFFRAESVIRDSSFETLGLSNSDPGVPFLSYLDDEKFYYEMCNNRLIKAIICRKDNVHLFDERDDIGIITSDNPRKEYFILHNRLSEDCVYNPEREMSTVGKNCRISSLASISNTGVEIGDDVVIEDFVKIAGPCRIGDNTIIHAGSIIGGVGYEFKRYEKDVLDVIHCGSVFIGNNVIIWENTTIHKAVYPWDSTTVGDWSRIGAHSHIDHGAKIEDLVEICAHCTISGRTHIKSHAFIGPGSIISNRMTIGEKAKVLIGSVVTKDVADEQVVSGNFAIDHDKHIHRVVFDAQTVV